jgi:hypothetical protein
MLLVDKYDDCGGEDDEGTVEEGEDEEVWPF